MTLTYRTAGAWGAGKGSNLTAAEIDSNFYQLDQRITALEGDIPDPIQITAISVAAGAISLLMSNATTIGPHPLSSARFTHRGDYAPSTAYNKLDIIRADAAAWLVLTGHTSAATFDSDAVDEGTNPLYGLISRDAQLTRTVTTIADNPGVGYGPWPDGPTLAHANGYIRSLQSDTDMEIKIPLNADVAFPIGTELLFGQWGAEPVNVYGDSGVTVNYPDSTVTNGLGSVIIAKKIGTDEWDIYGDTAP